jgi:cell division protein FtsW
MNRTLSTSPARSAFQQYASGLAIDTGNSLILIATTLIAIGLVMVASTTASLDRSLIEGAFWRTLFGRQAAFTAVGIAIMLAAARTVPWVVGCEARRSRVAVGLFLIAVLGLIATLVPGLAEPHNNSHRWIRIGPPAMAIRYQPSELTKVALVAFLAWVLSRPGVRPSAFRSAFLPAAGAIGLCVLLVGGQDFGTSALLGCIGLTVLIVAGCHWRHLVLLGGLGLAGMTALLVTFPYRMARLAAFRNYWDDPQGDGYQAVQSLATIASGGCFGLGLGGGVQKYGYVPASHTDFIFAVLCEETGAFGAMLVIGLYCGLLFVGYKIASDAGTRAERLLAFGLVATIGFQAAINIAVVTVVAPTKGISLPLLSAGGSGILTVCLALGILVGIAKHSQSESAGCD